MTINSEQIQALKAAAEKATPGEWGIQFGDEIYASDGVNHEQIAMLFSDNSARDAEFIAAANPAAILSLLAEHDADKALIAESVVLFETLRQRIAELEAIRAAAEKLVRCKGRYHSEQNYRALAALFGVSAPDLPPLDSEARTVTVKLPPVSFFDFKLSSRFASGAYVNVEAMNKELAAAGITLNVGE
ncbi:ead/Ea22-like family protein [Phytobacter diazotrophicus]|uniref:ead/Ea22-like family protein n=1 Tax=Phytobacter diazotrophicus TaxID=395631 RepID=UPI00232CD9AB|nr:ead/Ea22-like family protein [Phytobacter diazotrophicus]MDC0726597.1 ead/Ea22-like family protein [Phytobacter diazotrophicus]MDC0733848.1 ead/Ea22-like family protein [Phytobacter diazotrophicus]